MIFIHMNQKLRILQTSILGSILFKGSEYSILTYSGNLNESITIENWEFEKLKRYYINGQEFAYHKEKILKTFYECWIAGHNPMEW